MSKVVEARIDDMLYVNNADDLNKQINRKSNLFNKALRQKNKGGKIDERDCKQKKVLSQIVSPVGRYGPGRI